MTAQQKAEELFIKYRMRQSGEQPEVECLHQTKKCCLIAVDEIEKELFDAFQGFIGEKRKSFWSEVRREIEIKASV